MSAPPENKLYKANCHCGAVKFTVSMPPLESQELAVCNCAICTKHGTALSFVQRKQVEFQKGYDHLSPYFIKIRSLKFCSTCGTSILFDVEDPVKQAEDMVAVNSRTIDGIEMENMKFKHFDGKSFGKPYVVPE